VEGVKHTKGIRMRIIKPCGQSYYDFVEYCMVYEKIPVYKVVKETIMEMNKKGWVGALTPRVCLALLKEKDTPVSKATKTLPETVVG
jgi:hypothetical protein